MSEYMETDKPLISVVVPVYCVEQELPYCVDSILKQDYKRFEVILVDDGSPDSCGEICDKYASEDARVKVIHQKNDGLSAARNRGTAEAIGQFVTFVDSDDFVAPGFLSTLSLGIKDGNAQIAVCSAFTCTEHRANASEREFSFSILKKEDALRKILYQKDSDVSAWAKLYRRDTLLKYPYPVGKVYEDVLTTVQIFCNEECTAFTAAPLYGYYLRPGSIGRSERLDYRENEMEMTEKMLNYVYTHCPGAYPAAISKAFSNFCQIVNNVPAAGSGTELHRRAADRAKALAPYVLRDRQARLKNRIAAALAEINPELIAIIG